MSASLSDVDITEVHRRVEVCTQCDLWRTRTRAVPGAGDPEARLVFVGEAPGYHEDRQGLPFVGAAGKLLDDLLARIGMDRADVFITNIIKCRPPANRDPQAPEIEACHPYLDRQMELINPTVIATLGRFSMAHFLGPDVSISRIHGQPHRIHGRLIYPLFHPAAALRQERFRTALEEDFLKLVELLQSADVKPDDDPDEPAAQLSLF